MTRIRQVNTLEQHKAGNELFLKRRLQSPHCQSDAKAQQSRIFTVEKLAN